MKTIRNFIIAAFIFLGVMPVVMAANAASLKFDKTTVTVSNGGTFQIAVIVDPGSDSVSSTDVYVTYDASYLKANSVASGTLFPTVTNDTATSGKVYIAGLVNDPATSVTTSGTLATITFQSLKEGTANLSFDCNSSKVIKNDLNATNVLVCSQNGTSAVTIGSGGSSPTATTAPGAPTNTPAPTTPPGELPVSGAFDNVVKFAVPGTVLLMFGLAMRFIL